MKKNHSKIIIAAFIIGASFTIYSCSKDDDTFPTIEIVGIAQDPNNFKGDISNGQVVTLDPMKTYKLNGIVKVKSGGTLVIPAGTKITATTGAASYVLVEQGGKIYTNGTAGSPVLFTSETTTAGNWGGIVICGKAPVNTGSSSSSELGNLPYGGSETTDNSGALNYVRIEYAGAEFIAGKKFNGLSLFGVGNETRVESVALLNNADDGIEIYGGTVNISNIVSTGNANNAFSFKDGWIGTATGIYTKRKTDGTGNNGIEGINNETNPTATPKTNVTIKNVTVIGGNNTGESNGIRLYSGAHATIENAVISSWTNGINLESDATVSHFDGQSKIKDILFQSTVTNKVSAKSSAGTTVTLSANTFNEITSATGAGNIEATPTWAIGWSGLQ